MNKKAILDLIKKEAEFETQLKLVQHERDTLQKELQNAKSDADLYQKTANLLVETSLAIQKETTDKIAKIVTDMYQYVFQNTDEFVIKVDTKRSTPVASFYIRTHKDDKEILLDPLTSDGGGKVDVISLGLRIASLLLYKPAMERILFLDEPMRFLSSDETSCKPYRLRAAEFLHYVTKTYGIQIVAITHDKELLEFADLIYKVSLDKDGYSVVEEISNATY